MVIGILPDGWEWSTLDKYRKGKRESVNPAKFPEQKFELYSVPSFESRKPEIVFGKEVGSSKQVVHANEVLICKINPRINRSWVVGNYTDNPKIASTEWFVFEAAENLNPKYLCYFMQMDTFRDHLAANVSGVGGSLMRARSSSLENYPFPLAPLPEQERIVSRIEELFSDLEAGVAALERVRAGLKRYKASVLKAACEGELVNGKLGIGEGELPEGWEKVEFKEIITSLKNGYFYGRPATEPVGIPILRISAVRPMSVNYSDLRYVPDITEKDIENYFLLNGDLLFTRYNGNLSLVGACGLVRANSPRVIYPDKLIRVRVQDNVLPEYLEIYFATITARKLIEGRVKSTAGQHGISGGDIKSIPVILPPLGEQRRIVAEVERRLSVVGEVESAVGVGLVRAARLRQAVLRSAFEGRL